MVIMFSFDFDNPSKYILTTDWHPNKSVSVLHYDMSYLLISAEWNIVQTEKENASMIPLLQKKKKKCNQYKDAQMSHIHSELHPSAEQ